jgi:hypothetical protein
MEVAAVLLYMATSALSITMVLPMHSVNGRVLVSP